MLYCGTRAYSTARSQVISHHRIRNSAKVIPLFPPQSGTEEQEASDARLLQRVAQGDNEAFAVLVSRHTQRFYRVAYRFVRQQSEAEDIVQDAFLKLWEKPDAWQADRNTAFTTWFHRVVLNLCLDRAKKKRPQELLDDSWVEDERDNQEEVALASERQRLLDAQITELPERQRVALNLCFYEGLSNQEAADVMKLNLKALQALLMRAKTTLRERLRFMVGE
jgi:RNA polymerase sigma-70 factor, ECF subfamily